MKLVFNPLNLARHFSSLFLLFTFRFPFFLFLLFVPSIFDVLIYQDEKRNLCTMMSMKLEKKNICLTCQNEEQNVKTEVANYDGDCKVKLATF